MTLFLRWCALGVLLLCLGSGCAYTDPGKKPGRATGGDEIASSTVKALLKPNQPGLSFPVYETYAEVEPLFRQRDGRTYVVNFWATWCRPCIREMDLFEQLARETSNEEVQVILIGLDKAEDVRSKVKDFVRDRPLRLPTVAFTDNFYDGWIYKVDNAWQRSTIPVTLIYRDGKRYFNKGQISSYEELRGLVDRVR